ncbi:hypothetical protein MMOR_55560 [Mycolicibacterium moriokaense]|uniref:Uncharacterized protein n=2 Tax=Mycolicibacterium moriokaense TaxID=39691 RepID=A0AAD1M9L2_9MYCO|nr:hypothetical protein MMOR_55560 [Mycolicibacterium moriokaense]
MPEPESVDDDAPVSPEKSDDGAEGAGSMVIVGESCSPITTGGDAPAVASIPAELTQANTATPTMAKPAAT